MKASAYRAENHWLLYSWC